ncbi:hypothetical protein SDJN02_09987, partial [Cucurbita argyrosperma subsp. argyrosperma]
MGRTLNLFIRWEPSTVLNPISFVLFHRRSLLSPSSLRLSSFCPNFEIAGVMVKIRDRFRVSACRPKIQVVM